MTDDQRSIYTNQHAEDQRSINTSHQTDDQRWANSSQLRDQSIPEYDQRGISQLTDPKSTSSSKKNVFDFNRQTQNRMNFSFTQIWFNRCHTCCSCSLYSYKVKSQQQSIYIFLLWIYLCCIHIC
jgi:hypothetical protein